MRTNSIPPGLLTFLVPLLALAQPSRGLADNWQFRHSPLTWFWAVALVVAVAAFIFGYQAYQLAEERGGDGRGKAITAMAMSGGFLLLWGVSILLLLASAGTSTPR